MLEPRPEMRTPTRAFSAMMGRGPGGAGAPGFGRPGDGAALLAGFDAADGEDGFAHPVEIGADGFSLIRSGDQCHADAAAEGARHLAGLALSLPLEVRHQPRLPPSNGPSQ